MSAVSKVSATAEDYLEAILILERVAKVARVRDIAKRLNVHKSTVSATLKTLSDKNLVNYSPYEVTTLTSEGRKIAEKITSSHGIISRFLKDVLLVGDGIAEANACRMEHGMDISVVQRLVLFAGFLDSPASGDGNLREGFARYLEGVGALPAEQSVEQKSSDADVAESPDLEKIFEQPAEGREGAV